MASLSAEIMAPDNNGKRPVEQLLIADDGDNPITNGSDSNHLPENLPLKIVGKSKCGRYQVLKIPLVYERPEPSKRRKPNSTAAIRLPRIELGVQPRFSNWLSVPEQKAFAGNKTVSVMDVKKGSLADRAGIRPKDIFCWSSDPQQSLVLHSCGKSSSYSSSAAAGAVSSSLWSFMNDTQFKEHIAQLQAEHSIVFYMARLVVPPTTTANTTLVAHHKNRLVLQQQQQQPLLLPTGNTTQGDYGSHTATTTAASTTARSPGAPMMLETVLKKQIRPKYHVILGGGVRKFPDDSIYIRLLKVWWEFYEFAPPDGKRLVLEATIKDMTDKGVRFLTRINDHNGEKCYMVESEHTTAVKKRVLRALEDLAEAHVKNLGPREADDYKKQIDAYRNDELGRSLGGSSTSIPPRPPPPPPPPPQEEKTPQKRLDEKKTLKKRQPEKKTLKKRQQPLPFARNHNKALVFTNTNMKTINLSVVSTEEERSQLQERSKLQERPKLQEQSKLQATTQSDGSDTATNTPACIPPALPYTPGDIVKKSTCNELSSVSRDIVLGRGDIGLEGIYRQVLRSWWERYDLTPHNQKRNVCHVVIADMVSKGVRFLTHLPQKSRLSSGDFQIVDPYSQTIQNKVLRSLRDEVLKQLNTLTPREKRQRESQMDFRRQQLNFSEFLPSLKKFSTLIANRDPAPDKATIEKNAAERAAPHLKHSCKPNLITAQRKPPGAVGAVSRMQPTLSPAQMHVCRAPRKKYLDATSSTSTSTISTASTPPASTGIGTAASPIVITPLMDELQIHDCGNTSRASPCSDGINVLMEAFDIAIAKKAIKVKDPKSRKGASPRDGIMDLIKACELSQAHSSDAAGFSVARKQYAPTANHDKLNCRNDAQDGGRLASTANAPHFDDIESMRKESEALRMEHVELEQASRALQEKINAAMQTCESENREQLAHMDNSAVSLRERKSGEAFASYFLKHLQELGAQSANISRHNIKLEGKMNRLDEKQSKLASLLQSYSSSGSA